MHKDSHEHDVLNVQTKLKFRQQTQVMHATSAGYQPILISANHLRYLMPGSSLKLSALHLSHQLLCHSVILPHCSLCGFPPAHSLFLFWFPSDPIHLQWYVSVSLSLILTCITHLCDTRLCSEHLWADLISTCVDFGTESRRESVTKYNCVHFFIQ